MTNPTDGDELDEDDYAEDLARELKDAGRTNSTRNSFGEDPPTEPDQGDAGTAEVEPTDAQAKQMDDRQVADDERTDGGVDA